MPVTSKQRRQAKAAGLIFTKPLCLTPEQAKRAEAEDAANRAKHLEQDHDA